MRMKAEQHMTSVCCTFVRPAALLRCLCRCWLCWLYPGTHCEPVPCQGQQLQARQENVTTQVPLQASSAQHQPLELRGRRQRLADRGQVGTCLGSNSVARGSAYSALLAGNADVNKNCATATAKCTGRWEIWAHQLSLVNNSHCH
jgi:hypothetical protein